MDPTVAGTTAAELTGLLPPLATGLAAGLAVAMPLGAIGVLLLHEGMARGARTALAGAAGIASVDAAYATVAVVAGTWVATALAGRETAVRLVGAAVLGVIALRGLIGALRQPRSTGIVARAGAATTPAASVAHRAARVYARFVALTAINPLTAAAFAVLAAGLAQRWSTSADRAAFVVGVAVASSAWQAVLALVGALLGARVRARSDDRLRRVLGVGGFGLVGVLAVVLAVG
ncbi:LysE type translocator [mine drainage metagenome]|uniref:LysE type translocator n=1 Tax=mine drainage metagenome TaxID=410659 RepID=A0A1J5QGB4_9ZZZZ